MNRECVRHLLVRSGEGGDRVGRQEGDMFNTTGMLYAILILVWIFIIYFHQSYC